MTTHRLRQRAAPAALLATLALAACGSLVQRETPSISHVHIGHAITAWPLTPNKRGLLVTAELESVTATTNAELMLEAAREGDLGNAQRYLREVVASVDPELLDQAGSDDAPLQAKAHDHGSGTRGSDESRGGRYGLRRATAEAVTHLKLASEVPDATANVQRTVTRGNVRAQRIVDRADELVAFMDAGLRTENAAEMEIIAEEIALVLRRIAGGPGQSDVYGLYEFREEIEAMVAREDPPYRTVDSWFLFNLVKLPNGEWAFASRRSRGAAGAGY